jgi:hypothetical protein
MITIDRRTLLLGSVSTFAARTLPRAVLGATPILFLDTQPAQAWVMAAVAVASTVAGMIAANNRGDGGLGAMLSANYELLQVALAKLDDIQDRLTDIFKQLLDLPDKVDQLLKQQDTRRLHTELLAVVRGYTEKLTNRDPSLTDAQWCSDPNTQRDMGNLLSRLEKARQEVNVQNLLDPATALVATNLGFVETNIKNVLGYRRYEIVGTLTNIYMPWLDMILNPLRSDSTMGYTIAASKRLDEHMKSASENPIGKALGMKPGTTPLACTGVNDYTPEREEYEFESPTHPHPVAMQPGQGAETMGFTSSGHSLSATQPSQQLSLAQAAALTHLSPDTLGDINKLTKQPALLENTGIKVTVPCGWNVIGVEPARSGPRDRLAVDVTLKEQELIIDGKPTGILNYELVKGEERRAVAGSASVPADGQCEVQTLDMQDANARLNQMRAIPRRANAEKAYQELNQLIEQINQERCRIAFGSQAMVATQTTKQNLSELIRRYS